MPVSANVIPSPAVTFASGQVIVLISLVVDPSTSVPVTVTVLPVTVVAFIPAPAMVTPRPVVEFTSSPVKVLISFVVEPSTSVDVNVTVSVPAFVVIAVIPAPT